jgi:branched-chain amino acid transport system permease protein
VLFFLSLLVDGALAGAIYALIALAFVVVYKASRMVNFALGEWVMLGSRLVAAGVHVGGFGLTGALGAGAAGMVGLAVAFNATVLRRLAGQPLISFIMVSLGVGMLIRGVTGLVLARIPAGVALPLPRDVVSVAGVPIATDKLAAAVIAVLCIAALTLFFRTSRTGLALRALADDQQVAMSVGIDLERHFAIAWSVVGVLSLVAGVLWTAVAGGGFGLVLLGLRVFPIVIVGGLDSIPGTVVGALGIGVLESVAAGYLDPLVGGGFSQVASYLVLLIVLFVRPYGLFGVPDPERI